MAMTLRHVLTANQTQLEKLKHSAIRAAHGKHDPNEAAFFRDVAQAADAAAALCSLALETADAELEYFRSLSDAIIEPASGDSIAGAVGGLVELVEAKAGPS